MNGADSGKTGKLIIIVGFMGSGKTTVARELARLLKCRAIDLDESICERERRNPGEIIEQSGEEEFRRIEAETLRHVLNEKSDDSPTRILALGGGAWTIKTNRELIGRHEGIPVWLDTPFETCWRRIAVLTATRPLAPSEEKAAELYRERRSLYGLATIRLVIPETETASQTAGRIATALT